MLSFVLVSSVLLRLSTQQEVPGVLQQENLKPGRRTSDPHWTETCEGNRVYSTCDNCETVRVCLGNGMVERRNCRNISPDKPFCNNGECSATAIPACHSPFPPFSCTGSGYFPDPYRCDVYHYCENQNSASLEYKCPNNYVFNPETNFCKRRQRDADCMKVTCNPNVIFSSYGTSKRFFGYCHYSGMGPYSLTTKILRCPDGTQFNGKTCVFQCPAEGWFPDNADERGYYECYFTDNNELVSIPKLCPPGRAYNRYLYACVLVSTTTTTTTSSPTTRTTYYN